MENLFESSLCPISFLKTKGQCADLQQCGPCMQLTGLERFKIPSVCELTCLHVWRSLRLSAAYTRGVRKRGCEASGMSRGSLLREEKKEVFTVERTKTALLDNFFRVYVHSKMHHRETQSRIRGSNKEQRGKSFFQDDINHLFFLPRL